MGRDHGYSNEQDRNKLFFLVGLKACRAMFHNDLSSQIKGEQTLKQLSLVEGLGYGPLRDRPTI
jgi:hypothetical protein